MSTPDWFVVAWWLLAAAVGIPAPFLARRWRRLRRLDDQKAALFYLKGSPDGRYRLWRGMEATRLQIAFLVSIGLLVVGAVVLFYMEYWTRLTLLNAQILMVIIGVGVAALGLPAKAFERVVPSHRPWVYVPLIRIACFLFGIAIVAAGGMAAIRDIALPRRVIEGHVDSVDTNWRSRGPSEYVVVIDGKRLIATFEAFPHIQPARQVQV